MGSLHLFRDLPEVRSFTAGEYIFRKGERGGAMYLVIEGEIDLLVGAVLAETAGAGAFIGEMALIGPAPRSASARARTEARVFPIDEQRFQSLVRETPSFALDVMKALAQRLRRANDRAAARRSKHKSAKEGAEAPRSHRRRSR